MRSHSDPHRGNERALAFLRICVGILFLIFGQYKAFGTQFTLHGGFEFWINKFLQGGAYPFMAPILRGFVLPHARPIAFLVAYGELAIGIAFDVGSLGAAGQRFWIAVYGDVVVCVGFSGGGSADVAVFWGFVGPFGVGDLFRGVFDWESGFYLGGWRA